MKADMKAGMKVGMIGPVGSDLSTDGAFLRDYAGTIEECGVDSVWMVEHVVPLLASPPERLIGDVIASV